jgi:hypothetical protein
MSTVQKEVIESLLAERLAKESPFVLDKFLFKEQLDFVNEPDRFATAVCSVRAGKSIACAADLIHTALTMPKTTGLYVTLARSSAKRIIWPELKNINTDFKLNADPNESDLSMKFPNGSTIYCFGAGDTNEIEKIRGLSNVALVYLDESQAFRSHIKELVEDIVTKRLYDTNGRCRMIGTPGPIPAGYFYESSLSPQWAHHAWTLHQNPHIARKSGKTVEELIDQDCKRRGVTRDNASIQRECYGKWVLDSDSLVFKYAKDKNDYDTLPQLTDYVIAVDIGLSDADAIAVLGWHKHSTDCYLVEEVIHAGQDITTLANQIDAMVKKYNPLKVVMDTGGLGAKIAEELRKRFSLPIVAAEKTRKNEFISLLNDALRNGRLKAKANSRFAQDSTIIEWDMDKCTSDRLVMKSDPHSDICDAVLYGYREALHWLSTPEPVKIDLRTNWVKHTEKLMEEALQRQIDMEQSQEHDNDMFAIMDGDPFEENTALKHFLNKKKGRL